METAKSGYQQWFDEWVHSVLKNRKIQLNSTQESMKLVKAGVILVSFDAINDDNDDVYASNNDADGDSDSNCFDDDEDDGDDS